VITDEAVLVAPVASVSVTVYVVVLVGETVIDEVVAPPGDHEYVTGAVPPVAVAAIVTD